MPYIIKFEKRLDKELKKLQDELKKFSYNPKPLKKFIIRDPKTRTIHSSAFRDRVVHHALVNVLEPIFDPAFIHDSYASRKNKGTLKAVQRFDYFKRKISVNGELIENAKNNNLVKGYCLKADIKHYFQTVDHEILLNLIKRKINDSRMIWLIKKILGNYERETDARCGMPLGNLTSQFFANVYLNKIDQFVKHKLKAEYYIRYVDDFVVLHHSQNTLKRYKVEIDNFLKKELKLELHPNKCNIFPIRTGINFLGYRIFYHYKLLRESNLRKFCRNFENKINHYEIGRLSYESLWSSLEGWFGYAMWANTYILRRKIIKQVRDLEQ